MNGSEHNLATPGFIGQEQVSGYFDRVFSTGKVGSGYLFEGPSGVGKFTAALEFTRRLKCSRKKEDGTPCNECYNCRLINNLSHPDLEIVFPLPASLEKADDKLGPKELQEINEAIKTKAANPYYQLKFSQAVYIRIDKIRELEYKLAQTSSEAGGKVAIIVDADIMTTEAANAFLKTLEEPPPEVYLILTSARPSYLLPTIRSRIQRVRFSKLPNNLILEYLKSQGYEGSEAQVAAALSQGNLGRAFDLLSPQFIELRNKAFQMFNLFFEKEDLKILEWVDEFNKNNKQGELEVLMQNLSSLSRDLFLMKEAKGYRNLENTDRLDELERFVAALRDGRQIKALIGLINSNQSDFHLNPNLTLLILDTIFRGREILSSQSNA
ncbi:DNA polymerase III subunit delta' [bacterium]|nr:DNA polymerase III subunit delta' [bacterium]